MSIPSLDQVLMDATILSDACQSLRRRAKVINAGWHVETGGRTGDPKMLALSLLTWHTSNSLGWLIDYTTPELLGQPPVLRPYGYGPTTYEDADAEGLVGKRLVAATYEWVDQLKRLEQLLKALEHQVKMLTGTIPPGLRTGRYSLTTELFFLEYNLERLIGADPR